MIIPFKKETPQEFGRTHEKQRAKAEGFRIHPGSGAGRIKHDASDDETVVEYKTTGKSFSLNGKYLLDLFKVAVRQGKSAQMSVYFREADVTATITIKRGK